jgi:hypothetical protein
MLVFSSVCTFPLLPISWERPHVFCDIFTLPGPQQQECRVISFSGPYVHLPHVEYRIAPLLT